MSRIAFGPYLFDNRTRLLYRGDEEVNLPPRAAALLGHLIDRAGELVTKDELIELAWPDTQVSDTSLKEAVHILRQALGDPAKRAAYVQTVPRRGYRFVARVHSATESPAPVASRTRGTAWTLTAAAAILAGLWFAGRDASGPAPQPYRFTVEIPAEQRLSPGPANLALSPDGRYLIYAAKTTGSQWRLYQRPANELTARAIAGTENGRAPFFSSDGKTLAFFTRDELRTTPLVGGVVRTVCQVTRGLGGTWSGDHIIFSTFESRDAVGLWRVPASGGRPQVLTTRGAGETAHRWPEAIGEKAIVYTVWRSRLDDSDVALLDLLSGDSQVLLEGGGAARYQPGSLIYARSNELLMAPFDADRRVVTGPPVSAVRGVATTPVWGTAHFDVSENGSLIYMTVPTMPEHRLLRARLETPYSRSGIPTREDWEILAQLPRTVMDLRLAPDARHLLITTQGVTLDLWTLELARGALARLTDDGTSYAGIFSSDSGNVFYASRRPAAAGIYRRPAAGGEPELIYPSATAVPCAAVAVDGDSAAGAVLIAELDQENGWDLGILDTATGKVRPFLTTPFHEKRATLSSNGELVAYESDETGTSEIYLRRFPLGTARWPASSQGGSHPLFSPDGRELFFRRGREIFSVQIDPGAPEPQIGPAVPRFEAPDVAGYSMALDHQTVLRLDNNGDAPARPNLVYVVHFSEEY